MFGSARNEAPAGQTRRTWTKATISLIAISLAAAVSGSVYIGLEQRQLDAIGLEQRQLRMARQALMETETAVLNTIVTSDAQSGLIAYAAARNKLDTHPADHFPSHVLVDGRPAEVGPLLASLKSTWTQMVALIGAGDLDGARALHASHAVTPRMTGLVQAAVHDLEALDRAYEAKADQVSGAIGMVLVFQILSGLLGMGAFLMAARRSSEEAKARALAVTSAEQTREQVMRLFRMTDMLQSAADHSDANAVLASTAQELAPGVGGALYIFNNSRDRLVLSTSWNMDGQEDLPETLSQSQCWALKRGKPHRNHPAGAHLACEHHHGHGHMLEFPMAARGEILGLLQFHVAGEDGDARLDEIAGIGEAMADAMSLALANIALRDKLRGQALRDPLTGLYNRRYMEDTLQRVTRLAEREKQEVSVIMIDLDHFKRLNDSYGHAKGDAVLRDAAAILINNLRESDVACRYGGEELIVVLPNCSLEVAVQKAERMREAIEGLSEAGGAQVSASMGVACMPSTTTSTGDLVKAADAALYRAKDAGRNRVETAPPLKSKSGKGKAGDLSLIAAE